MKDAPALIASLRLPAGATRSSHTTRVSSRTESATSRARWANAEAPLTVFNYIKAHPPRGATSFQSGSGWSPGDGLMLMYSWRNLGLELYGRQLTIVITPRAHGGSAISATSTSGWIVPRPAAAQVPSSVRVIDVTLRIGRGAGLRATRDMRTSRYVVRRATSVAAIVRESNALQGLAMAASSWVLMMPREPLLTLRFRAKPSGPVLASAKVLVSAGSGGSAGWNSCDPIDFWIGGKRRAPLTSQTFVRQIGKLIGADIS